MKTIDELMDTDPDDLTNQDLDDMIAYERKMRGLAESGIKPIKVEGEKKKLDSAKILAGIRGQVPAPEVPKPKIARRM